MKIHFDKKNRKKVLKAINGQYDFKKLNTIELHQFILNYNYDDGLHPFEWIVEQNIVDKGSVLNLYWLLSPSFFCQKGGEVTNEDYRIFDKQLKLIKKIEQKYLGGFYKNSSFYFNPKDEFLKSDTDTSCIPHEMCLETEGVVFNKEELEVAFFRKLTDKEVEQLQSKIIEGESFIQMFDSNFTIKNAPMIIIDMLKYCLDNWNEITNFKQINKLNILSYLWYDCVVREYNWQWVIFDWEDDRDFFIINPSKDLACGGNNIITYTFPIEGTNNVMLDPFQSTNIVIDLFNILKDTNTSINIQPNPYTGIGLLKNVSHIILKD